MTLYTFDYKEYGKFEKTLSAVEKKVIADHFHTVVSGNSSFEDKSSAELSESFWIFQHGWICRSMLV